MCMDVGLMNSCNHTMTEISYLCCKIAYVTNLNLQSDY